MRVVAMTMILASLSLAGCNRSGEQANNGAMSLDEGMPNGVSANADIETLPADESSTTPSNQLQNGIDAPEESDAANSGNAY